VPLRPHQLQSLARLLQRERAPAGFNSLLWSQITLGEQQMWLSLVMGKLSATAPPATVTGGFLCDEMGLGVCMLVLLFLLLHS
jgi:hypothetical protein